MFFSDAINKNNKNDIRDISSFLNGFDVKYDFPEKTFVIRDKGHIISTGSINGNILKYFFTSCEYKSKGTISIIYKSLLNHLIEQDHDSYFVFTSPNNKKLFESLGLKIVYETQDVALLEAGFYNYNKWINKVKAKLPIKNGPRGAIVMNCNPMTLGHKFLIEKALKEVDDLIIFVVEEEQSVFPFRDRWRMLEAELGEDKRINLIGSGPYIISRATFPTYFLKEKDNKLDIYTKLDAGIFGEKVAKDLDIDIRFLGTEPIDILTRTYNENIIEILKDSNIDVRVVKRKKMNNEIISASYIRELLGDGKIDIAYKYLPDATITFLESEKGKRLAKKLK